MVDSTVLPIATISTKSIPNSGKNVKDKDKDKDSMGRNPCWVGLDNGELSQPCERGHSGGGGKGGAG